ncbi:uncharacterized protein LOC112093544 [Morus notabilis]|uniref:uncharacterized protein LOC112093544 n=1 Tax=Morus notabilis TaxID=981085 RepID=UPI000CED4393|nr:uncharacterized protein LOC112093544 [Morus notabilis]
MGEGLNTVIQGNWAFSLTLAHKCTSVIRNSPHHVGGHSRPHGESAKDPSLSFPPRHWPPPPSPSPFKWAIMDEPDDTRRITRICDLPEKAVVEIMSWLPPKSLLGLKYEADHDNNQIRFHSKEFNLLESVAGLHGFHCDGIVFLPDRSTNKIVLCNPAIREFKLLQGSCFGSNFGKHIMAGFGYDAISNVYKVVRVVRLHSTDVDAPIGAEVCTLGGNHGESLREIKMEIEIDITSFTQ